MGYTSNDNMVRADFFKPSGKWKYTDALDMTELYWDTCGQRACPGNAGNEHPIGHSLWDALARSWVRLAQIRPDGHVPYQDLIMVVLEPIHEHGHPVAMGLDLSGHFPKGTPWRST